MFKEVSKEATWADGSPKVSRGGYVTSLEAFTSAMIEDLWAHALVEFDEAEAAERKRKAEAQAGGRRKKSNKVFKDGRYV